MVFSHESIWLQDMLNSKAANANVEEVNGHQDVPDTKITTVEAKEKDTSSWKAEFPLRVYFVLYICLLNLDIFSFICLFNTVRLLSGAE